MEHQSSTADTVSPAPPRNITRTMLIAVGICAAITAVAGVVSAAAGTLERLTATSLQVDSVPLGNVEAASFSDQMDEAAARYDTVSIELLDPPPGLVQLDALTGVVQLTPFVLLGAMICWLCWSALKGRPFLRTSPWVLGASGFAIVAFDLLGSILQGRVLAAVVKLAGPGSTAGDYGAGPVEGIVAGSSYDGDFFAAGVLLIVVASVFGLGSAMQRDTERLV